MNSFSLPKLALFDLSAGGAWKKWPLQAMSEETPEKKNKKVNKMDLAEVTAAIKRTEEHMKGLSSKYARALLNRKAELETSR